MTHTIPATPEEDALVRLVAEHYSELSDLRTIERNTVGAINKIFICTTPSGKYALRESNEATRASHLAFEIEIYEFFSKQDAPFIAKLLPTKHGTSIFELNGRMYMLQTFVEGEVVAKWDNPEVLSPAQFDELYRTTATFSKIASGFTPRQVYPLDSVGNSMETFEKRFDELIAHIPDSASRQFMLERRENIFASAAETLKRFTEIDYYSIRKQLTHVDLHAGNFHFKGDKVTGLFDFDWAGMDIRLSDLASLMSETCYDISTTKTGKFDKEKIQRGLAVYRAAFGPSEFSEKKENEIIAACLQAFVLIQILWLLKWFRNNSDHPEALFHAQYRALRLSKVNDYVYLFDLQN